MHNKTILPRGAADAAGILWQLTGSVELFVMGNGGLQPARPMMQMMLMTAAATATAAEDRGGSSDRIRTGITRDISGEKSDIIPHTGKSSDAAPSERVRC